ncbi:MFS general substrate transporter [Roridomyces roridus]|uniref:MFS general substrate transporter n=1 Tax=Roridomyces roridus TaxID=1738132 RepID=A0AAD7FYQ0_9AGAR|nr:MFS general substrate transporter [Roridomyces roridus]
MSGASVDLEASSKLESPSDGAPSLHKEENSSELKLDSHGLPLVPQPSSDPSDPLNFPQWLKIAILLQVSFLSGLGPLNQAVINPAYVPLAAHFHKTTVVASYQTTIAIAFVGVGAFLWVPLANTYGRRPVLLFTSLLAAASSIASGKALTWSQLIGTRVLNGIATASFFTVGAGMVSDTFFLHERGRAMGVFTVFLTNSAHVAPIPGGFLAQYVNYRWCYYLVSLPILPWQLLDPLSKARHTRLDPVLLMLFCLPETLYVRGSTPVATSRPILRRMGLWNLRPAEKHLKMSDFLHSFIMFTYPTVLLSAFYYSIAFGFSSILPAVTSATLFRLKHKFTTSHTGLALGFGTLIGFYTWRTFGRKGKAGGEAVPEVRLSGIWAGAIIQPVCTPIFARHRIVYALNFLIIFSAHWIGPTLGFTIMSPVLYSYCADSYRPQTPEVAQVFNFGRQTFGMTIGFWAMYLRAFFPWEPRSAIQFMGLTLALLSLGEAIRKKMGAPNFNSKL